MTLLAISLQVSSKRQLITAPLIPGCAADCQPAREAELLYNPTVSSHIRRGASMPTTFAPPGRQASPEELTARRSSWPAELPHSGLALFARAQVRCGCTPGSSKAAFTLQVWHSIILKTCALKCTLRKCPDWLPAERGARCAGWLPGGVPGHPADADAARGSPIHSRRQPQPWEGRPFCPERHAGH